MEIREFAFRQLKPPSQVQTVILKCSDCGLTETRRKIELYTGHMYEQGVTHVCTECRGDMRVMNDKPKEEK